MDLSSHLMDTGFTESEAKVYLALLGDYPATGYQISKAAGIPRSMVYEALGRLKGRGAVLETVKERVTQYRPLPPDVLLDEHERAHRQRMGDLRQGLRTLYEQQEEDRVWTISGRASVLSYATQMIRQAGEELYLVLNDPDLLALKGEIAAACQRGVDAGILLTGEGELTCGRVVRHPPLESELHELAGTLLVAADRQEVLVAGGDLDMTATVTHNRDLVHIARQFVWMELFAQRVFGRLGDDLLALLDPEDRAIIESLKEMEEGS